MTFGVIQHRGQVRKAETAKGATVEREEYLFVPEWGQFIQCAPYDEHFIYQDPDGPIGGSAFLCTCGSAAVVINPERDSGRMFVCLMHATYGAHSTSFVDRKDFPGVAGQVLDIKPEKARWL